MGLFCHPAANWGCSLQRVPGTNPRPLGRPGRDDGPNLFHFLSNVPAARHGLDPRRGCLRGLRTAVRGGRVCPAAGAVHPRGSAAADGTLRVGQLDPGGASRLSDLRYRGNPFHPGEPDLAGLGWWDRLENAMRSRRREGVSPSRMVWSTARNRNSGFGTMVWPPEGRIAPLLLNRHPPTLRGMSRPRFTSLSRVLLRSCRSGTGRSTRSPSAVWYRTVRQSPAASVQDA